jgi:hypothetical protein
LVRVVAISGLVIFSVLALVASVSVGNRFDPVPLIIILAMGAASALYTVRVVPGLQAAEAARRAARPTRRRPPRAPDGDVAPPPPGVMP